MSETAKTSEPGSAGDAGTVRQGAAPVADDSAAPVPAVDPRLLVREQGFKGYLDEFRRKVSGGELGSLPVIIGLIVIGVIFQSLDSSFLSPDSLNSIAVFTAVFGIMSVGIVFVLLLGEIDLSVGSMAGLGAAVWAVLSVTHGLGDWLSILIAIASGTAIGAIHGFFFAKVGVPAFVVTLAGFLGWSGLQIWVMGQEGTINVPNGSFVEKLTNFYFDDVAAAYGLAAVAVAAYLGSMLLDSGRRRTAGLPFRPPAEVLVRAGVLAVIAFVAAYELNQARGLPLALVIFLVILVVADFVVRRTTYGRQIFAVGGGIEAARRAGISVAKVRITVFMIAGTLSAIGGLFVASIGGGATKGLGGGNMLMNVIAAAVIGGTSLFGGRGKIWSALLGMLVIQSITQGLNLLGMASEIQYMITGAVLLGAVVIDSLSRKTQKASGRA